MRNFVVSALLVTGDRLWSYTKIVILGLLIIWVALFLTRPIVWVGNSDAPTWVTVTLVTPWVIALVVLVSYMARPTTRAKMLQRLMRDGDYGWLSPLLWAGAIFLFTAMIFSAVTQLLWERGAVDLSNPSCAATPCDLTFDDFFNFYTWHLLESIPLLRINEHFTGTSRSYIKVRPLDG